MAQVILGVEVVMIIKDAEFGEVLVRKNAWSRGVKFTVSTSGRLSMTVPKNTPNFLLKHYLSSNRENIKAKLPINDPATQRTRDYQKKVLKKKAQDYLPYRLDYYAKLYGYKYDNFKLTHANTRWGSCTHRMRGGRDEITISLNIGLMKLPEVLRDYVILHELSHINNPNHSSAFWAEVGKHDVRYKIHDKKLKAFSPGV